MLTGKHCATTWHAFQGIPVSYALCLTMVLGNSSVEELRQTEISLHEAKKKCLGKSLSRARSGRKYKVRSWVNMNIQRSLHFRPGVMPRASTYITRASWNTRNLVPGTSLIDPLVCFRQWLAACAGWRAALRPRLLDTRSLLCYPPRRQRRRRRL